MTRTAILAAAITLLSTGALAQDYDDQFDPANPLPPMLRAPARAAWDNPYDPYSMRLPSAVSPDPIMYPIPGIPTHPQPYTPDPPPGSGAPYQPRW